MFQLFVLTLSYFTLIYTLKSIYEKKDEYSKIKIMDEKNIMLHYVDYLMQLSFVRIVKIIFLVQNK